MPKEFVKPTLQILSVSCEEDLAGDKYKMVLSDGQTTGIAVTSVLLNNFHKSDLLHVLTVVQIDKYKIDTTSENFILMISALTIIRDQLYVIDILENPKTDLDLSLLKNKIRYLKTYQGNRFDFYQTLTSRLTIGSLQAICNGIKLEQISLQILDMITIVEKNKSISYSLFVSDSCFSINNLRINSIEFHRLVTSGQIAKHSIIYFSDYDIIITKDSIRVNARNIIPVGEIEMAIGQPKLMGTPLLGKGKTIPLSLIMNGVVVIGAVLQVVDIKKRSPLFYIIKLFDGFHTVSAAFLFDQIKKTTIDEKLKNLALIVLDKYSLQIGGEPVLRVLNLTFLDSTDCGFDSIIEATPAFEDKTNKIYYVEDENDEADRLACIISNSKLTSSCLVKLIDGTKYDKPIVQVLTIVKVLFPEFDSLNYRLVISDGINCYNHISTKSSNFNNLIKSGEIEELTIIRIDKFKLLPFGEIRICNVTVLKEDDGSKSKKIGEPLLLTNTLGIIMDSQIIVRNKKFVPKLTDGCLTKILKTYAYSLPILQIIKTLKDGSDYKLIVSDSKFTVTTASLNSDLIQLAETGKLKNFTVIRIDSYEVIYDKEDEVNYRQCLNILKVTVICQGGFNIKQQIGKPIEFNALQRIVQDDLNKVKKIEKITKTPKSSRPGREKRNTDLSETSHSLKIEKMLERQIILNEQINVLSLKLEEVHKAREEFKNDIQMIEAENTKLKVQIDNLEKHKVMEKQDLVKNDLEIFGIRERENENLFSIIVQLCLTIRLHIQRNDIKLLLRDPKSKLIIVSFVDKKYKIIFLTKINQLSEMQGAKIKCTQRLTPHNKNMLSEANKLMKDGKCLSVDVDNGRVMAKTNELDSKTIHIFSFSQIFHYKNK